MEYRKEYASDVARTGQVLGPGVSLHPAQQGGRGSEVLLRRGRTSRGPAAMSCRGGPREVRDSTGQGSGKSAGRSGKESQGSIGLEFIEKRGLPGISKHPKEGNDGRKNDRRK